MKRNQFFHYQKKYGNASNVDKGFGLANFGKSIALVPMGFKPIEYSPSTTLHSIFQLPLIRVYLLQKTNFSKKQPFYKNDFRGNLHPCRTSVPYSYFQLLESNF